MTIKKRSYKWFLTSALVSLGGAQAFGVNTQVWSANNPQVQTSNVAHFLDGDPVIHGSNPITLMSYKAAAFGPVYDLSVSTKDQEITITKQIFFGSVKLNENDKFIVNNTFIMADLVGNSPADSATIDVKNGGNLKIMGNPGLSPSKIRGADLYKTITLGTNSGIRFFKGGDFSNLEVEGSLDSTGAISVLGGSNVSIKKVGSTGQITGAGAIQKYVSLLIENGTLTTQGHFEEVTLGDGGANTGGSLVITGVSDNTAIDVKYASELVVNAGASFTQIIRPAIPTITDLHADLKITGDGVISLLRVQFKENSSLIYDATNIANSIRGSIAVVNGKIGVISGTKKVEQKGPANHIGIGDGSTLKIVNTAGVSSEGSVSGDINSVLQLEGGSSITATHFDSGNKGVSLLSINVPDGSRGVNLIGTIKSVGTNTVKLSVGINSELTVDNTTAPASIAEIKLGGGGLEFTGTQITTVDGDILVQGNNRLTVTAGSELQQKAAAFTKLSNNGDSLDIRGVANVQLGQVLFEEDNTVLKNSGAGIVTILGNSEVSDGKTARIGGKNVLIPAGVKFGIGAGSTLTLGVDNSANMANTGTIELANTGILDLDGATFGFEDITVQGAIGDTGTVRVTKDSTINGKLSTTAGSQNLKIEINNGEKLTFDNQDAASKIHQLNLDNGIFEVITNQFSVNDNIVVGANGGTINAAVDFTQTGGTVTSAGDLLINATGNVTLLNMALTANNELTLSGTGNITVGDVDLQASNAINLQGTGNVQFQAMNLTAVNAQLTLKGTGDVKLGDINFRNNNNKLNLEGTGTVETGIISVANAGNSGSVVVTGNSILKSEITSVLGQEIDLNIDGGNFTFTGTGANDSAVRNLILKNGGRLSVDGAGNNLKVDDNIITMGGAASEIVPNGKLIITNIVLNSDLTVSNIANVNNINYASSSTFKNTMGTDIVVTSISGANGVVMGLHADGQKIDVTNDIMVDNGRTLATFGTSDVNIQKVTFNTGNLDANAANTNLTKIDIQGNSTFSGVGAIINKGDTNIGIGKTLSITNTNNIQFVDVKFEDRSAIRQVATGNLTIAGDIEIAGIADIIGGGGGRVTQANNKNVLLNNGARFGISGGEVALQKVLGRNGTVLYVEQGKLTVVEYKKDPLAVANPVLRIGDGGIFDGKITNVGVEFSGDGVFNFYGGDIKDVNVARNNIGTIRIHDDLNVNGKIGVIDPVTNSIKSVKAIEFAGNNKTITVGPNGEVFSAITSSVPNAIVHFTADGIVHKSIGSPANKIDVIVDRNLTIESLANIYGNVVMNAQNASVSLGGGIFDPATGGITGSQNISTVKASADKYGTLNIIGTEVYVGNIGEVNRALRTINFDHNMTEAADLFIDGDVYLSEGIRAKSHGYVTLRNGGNAVIPQVNIDQNIKFTIDISQRTKGLEIGKVVGSSEIGFVSNNHGGIKVDSIGTTNTAVSKLVVVNGVLEAKYANVDKLYLGKTLGLSEGAVRFVGTPNMPIDVTHKIGSITTVDQLGNAVDGGEVIIKDMVKLDISLGSADHKLSKVMLEGGTLVINKNIYAEHFDSTTLGSKLIVPDSQNVEIYATVGQTNAIGFEVQSQATLVLASGANNNGQGADLTLAQGSNVILGGSYGGSIIGDSSTKLTVRGDRTKHIDISNAQVGFIKFEGNPLVTLKTAVAKSLVFGGDADVTLCDKFSDIEVISAHNMGTLRVSSDNYEILKADLGTRSGYLQNLNIKGRVTITAPQQHVLYTNITAADTISSLRFTGGAITVNGTIGSKNTPFANIDVNNSMLQIHGSDIYSSRFNIGAGKVLAIFNTNSDNVCNLGSISNAGVLQVEGNVKFNDVRGNGSITINRGNVGFASIGVSDTFVGNVNIHNSEIALGGSMYAKGLNISNSSIKLLADSRVVATGGALDSVGIETGRKIALDVPGSHKIEVTISNNGAIDFSKNMHTFKGKLNLLPGLDLMSMPITYDGKLDVEFLQRNFGGGVNVKKGYLTNSTFDVATGKLNTKVDHTNIIKDMPKHMRGTIKAGIDDVVARGERSPLYDAVINANLAEDSATSQKILHSILPKNHSDSSKATTSNASNIVNHMISGAIANRSYSHSVVDSKVSSVYDPKVVAASASSSPDFGLWIMGLRGVAKRGKYKGDAGYKSVSGGAIFGYDARLTDNFVLGGAISTLNSIIKPQHYMEGDKIKVKPLVLSVYGSNSFGNLSILYTSSFVRSEINALDNQTTDGVTYKSAISKYNMYGANLETKLSYKIQLSKRVALAPMIGGRYEFESVDAYTETGTANILYSYDKRKNNIFTGILGARLSSLMETDTLRFEPSLYANVDYRFSKSTPAVTATVSGTDFSMAVSAIDMPKLNYYLGAALNIKSHRGLGLEVGYNTGRNAAKSQSHQGYLKLRIEF